jgi:UDP-3-O-[3-hydroxymyristoyl] glucosamine N-acyltransferase
MDYRKMTAFHHMLKADATVVITDAFIGYHSIVDGCIIDENVYIGKFCYVGFGAGILPGNQEITVLGKDVTVPDHTAIGQNCSVRPGLGPEAFGKRLIPAGTTLVRS